MAKKKVTKPTKDQASYMRAMKIYFDAVEDNVRYEDHTVATTEKEIIFLRRRIALSKERAKAERERLARHRKDFDNWKRKEKLA